MTQVAGIITQKGVAGNVTQKGVYGSMVHTESWSSSWMARGLRVINNGTFIGWYDSTDLDTIIKNDSQHISRWNNKLGVTSLDLKNVLGTPHWSTDGVLFDGIGDSLKSDDFAYVKPQTLYIVIKQITWTASDYLVKIGGNAIIYQNSATPKIRQWGNGIDGTLIDNFPVNEFKIIRAVFNQATSTFQVDKEVKVANAIGDTSSVGSICLGASDSGSNFSNIQIKEAIFGSVIDTAEDEEAIYNYLYAKFYFLNNIMLPDIYINSGINSIIQYNQLMNLDGRQLSFTPINSLTGSFTNNATNFDFTPDIADIGNKSCRCDLKTSDLRTILTKNINLRIADQSLTPIKKILCIGDSLTEIGKYQHELLTELPGTLFLGTRTTSANNIQSEGRGGWKIDWLSSRIYDGVYQHSPFIQPSGDYKYYGATGFWKNTWVDPNNYDVYGYTAVRDAKGFIQATGYLSSPNINDVIYDTDLAVYKTWDGNSWETITTEELAFSINFTKYLSVWEIELPDFVSFMLITNDAAWATNEERGNAYATYKNQLLTLVNSILSTGVKMFYLIPQLPIPVDYNEYIQRRECFIYFVKNILVDFGSIPNLYIIDAGSEFISEDYADWTHESDLGAVKISRKIASAIRIYS